MRFDFGGSETETRGYTRVGPDSVYADDTGFGFEPGDTPLRTARGRGAKPVHTAIYASSAFRYSVGLSEGTYRVRLALGNPDGVSDTAVKVESRKLMAAQTKLEAGNTKSLEFLVNIRTPKIDGQRAVALTHREVGALRWDDKLTIEFLGATAFGRKPDHRAG